MPCADPESFVRTNFVGFLVDEGREDPNTTIRRAIISPPAKRHSNCPTLNAGLAALGFSWDPDQFC